MRWLLIVCCSLYAGGLMAGVYRCLDETGIETYQDRPCRYLEDSEFLPYQTVRTHKKAAQLRAKRLAQSMTTTKTPNKRKKKSSKKAQTQAAKAERRKERCLQTQRKIKMVRRKLRTGCKVKQYDRLRDQLEHHEHMKRRYCQ